MMNEEQEDVDSYLDDTNDNELVVSSERYDTRKIIKKSEFRTNYITAPVRLFTISTPMALLTNAPPRRNRQATRILKASRCRFPKSAISF